MVEELGVSFHVVLVGQNKLETSQSQEVGVPQFERSPEIIAFPALFLFDFAQLNRSFLVWIVSCDEMRIFFDKRRPPGQ